MDQAKVPSSQREVGFFKSWYLAVTSLHGLPELNAAEFKVTRMIWAIALLASAAALVAQAVSLTKAYIEDGVGTQETMWLPSDIPPVILCPQFEYFEGPNMTPELADFLTGYFQFSAVSAQMAEQTYTYRPEVSGLVKQGKELLAMYNNSKTDMVMGLTMEGRFVQGVFSVVVPEPTVSRIVLNQGLCYIAKSTGGKVTRRTALMAYLMLVADTSRKSQHPKGVHYTMFFGGPDDNGAFVSGIKDNLAVMAGKDLIVQIRAVKRVIYAGRKKDRCKKYTTGDYVHCTEAFVNDRYHDSLGCDMGPLASANYPEVKSDNFCNLHSHTLAIMDTNTKAAKEAGEILEHACHIPCEQTSYEAKISETDIPTGEKNVSKIIVTLDSPANSKEIVEYPLVSCADFLAGLGGTFGLYFGASLLSFVQIIAAGFEVAMRRKQIRAEVKNNNSGKH